jgi:hypothetical protein
MQMVIQRCQLIELGSRFVCCDVLYHDEKCITDGRYFITAYWQDIYTYLTRISGAAAKYGASKLGFFHQPVGLR